MLEQFAIFFGTEARAPKDYFETDWPGERWRGGPVGHPRAGNADRDRTALRQPVPRVHWFGTETANLLERVHGRRVQLRRARRREVMDAL